MSRLLSRSDLLNTKGIFYHDLGDTFYIETKNGNYVWEDPFYGGDGSLIRVSFSLKEWTGNRIVKRKGEYYIGWFCGNALFMEGVLKQ